MTRDARNLFNIAPRGAREIAGGRFAFLVAGPAGTGKSHLLGSMIREMPTVLLATLGREANSDLYQQYDVPTIELFESSWRSDDMKQGTLPSDIKVEAFRKFLATCEWLRDDDQYDAVILDNGTELGEHAWHEALLPHGVISPAFMTDKSRWTPYETLTTTLDQGIKALVNLTSSSYAKRPKYVGISWHVQPPKDDTTESVGEGANRIRVTKESSDSKGEGVEFEGKILPQIRGGFRRKLAAQLDAVVFSTILHERVSIPGQRPTTVPRYVIQVQPDEERHAKIPGTMSAEKYINNEFGALRTLVEATKKSPTQTIPAAPAVAASEATRPAVRRTAVR